MCGLIGYSGNDNYNVQNIKTLILWNSALRGEDSTGIYSPNNGLKKWLEKGHELIVSNNFDLIEDNFLIGHVRAKTVGANSIDNSHPFSRGNYMLAHNGTLKNYYSLETKYELKGNYQVDSDILCGAISKSKSFTPLSEIDGPAAVLIQDITNSNVLYAFRNSERPLFYGKINSNMYISSIKESLIFIGCENIKEFKQDILYNINKGLIVKTTKIKNNKYYHNFTNNNNINKNIGIHDLQKAIGCRLRSDSNLNITYYTTPFSLKKDEYYLIKARDSDYYVQVEDENNNTCSIYIGNFLKADIIEKNCYVKSLYNITHHENSNVVLINTNQIVQVNDVFLYDGTIQLKDVDSGKIICVAEKSYFIKLNESEYAEFISKNNKDFLNSLKENNDSNSNTQLVVVNNNTENNTTDFIEEKEDDFIEEDVIYEKMYDNSNLIDTISMNVLNELKDLNINSNIINNINNIIDLNKENVNNLISL